MLKVPENLIQFNKIYHQLTKLKQLRYLNPKIIENEWKHKNILMLGDKGIVYRNIKKNGTTNLYFMGVDPKYQNLGFGSRMVRELKTESLHIILKCKPSLVDFWNKQGFTTIEVNPEYYKMEWIEEQEQFCIP